MNSSLAASSPIVIIDMGINKCKTMHPEMPVRQHPPREEPHQISRRMRERSPPYFLELSVVFSGCQYLLRQKFSKRFPKDIRNFISMYRPVSCLQSRRPGFAARGYTSRYGSRWCRYPDVATARRCPALESRYSPWAHSRGHRGRLRSVRIQTTQG